LHNKPYEKVIGSGLFYTVNTVEVAKQLLESGVDLVETDDIYLLINTD